MLNIGCGQNFHHNWTNVDLVPVSAEVEAVDIRKGLPFDAESFDAVYHSHVLEHLAPQSGIELIRDCRRVLRLGGILRVAVPDLEQVARLYLQSLELAAGGDETGINQHQWMTLEFLDQLTRTQSGGKMGPYMQQTPASIRDFVRGRMGDEFDKLDPENQRPDPVVAQVPKPETLPVDLPHSKPFKWAEKAVRTLLGKHAVAGLREGCFRQSGEVHRWMYDRISLRQLLLENGFADVRKCRADESRIDQFAMYELDTVDGRARKPDSLFMEGVAV